MTQVTDYSIPGSPLTMAALAERLEDLFAAAGDCNRGGTAPSNPFQGMLWWDTSLDPVEHLRRYTVAGGWISLLSINNTTGAVLTVYNTTIANIVTLAGTQNLTNKTSTDGFRITGGGLSVVGGDLTIRPSSGTVARVVAGSSVETTMGMFAGGYTSSADSGTIFVRSKDHATAPGTVSLNGTDGTTAKEGLRVLTDGIVNIPQGLQIGGTAVPFSYTTFTPGGDLSSGSIYITKIGRTVTMTWPILTHASNYSAYSAVGAVTSAYQPVLFLYSLTYMGISYVCQITIGTNGQIGFIYRDWGGNTINQTNTPSGSISWVSAS